MKRVIVRATLAVALCVGWFFLLYKPDYTLTYAILTCVPIWTVLLMWFGFEITFFRLDTIDTNIKNLAKVSNVLIEGGIYEEADLRIKQKEAIMGQASELIEDNLPAHFQDQ